MFLSAYKRLLPAQKAYVDAYVTQAERDAERRNERISLALHRPVAPDADGMLDLPMVQAAIAERINERAASEEFTWQRWLKEVANVAFSNVNDFQTVLPDGTTKIDLTKAKPEHMAAIKSIETEETAGYKRKVKLQLHDKMGALKMMADFYVNVMQHNPSLMAPPRDAVIDAGAALPVGSSVEDAQAAFARLAGE